MKIVFYGLTITSSWGNGHATTYRSLLKALHRRGHDLLFIEKDVEWYRSHRDLPSPSFCAVQMYADWASDQPHLLEASADADAIVIGSYFPDAIALMEELAERSRHPLFFYDIDTPITMTHLRETGACPYLDAALIPEFAAYLSFTGGPMLQELEQRFHARHAHAFFCSVDPEIYHPVPAQETFAADLSYLGTYAADRQSKLMHLVNDAATLDPGRQFLVAGPQYPETIAWNTNVRRMTHVDPSDHPAFYCSSRFTLNLTRSDMVSAGWSPSVRLFEASACGATILSDAWAGLSDFLTPGEEVLLPANANEVTRLLRDLGDADRQRVGRQAQARVLDQHTSDHRAIQFEQIVSQWGS